MKRTSSPTSDTAPQPAIAKTGGQGVDVCVGCGLCGGHGRQLISPELLQRRIEDRSADRRTPTDH